MDFRLCVTKIASVQKTCRIDPKVLGAVALRGVASVRVRSQGLGRLCDRRHGRDSTQKNLFHSRTSIVRLEWLVYEGFFALFGGVGDMRPDGMRRWEGGTSSI